MKTTFVALFAGIILLSDAAHAKTPLLQGKFRGKFPGAAEFAEIEFVKLASKDGTASRISACNFLYECNSNVTATDTCAEGGKCNFLASLAISKIDFILVEKPWVIEYLGINGVGLLSPKPVLKIQTENEGKTGLVVSIPFQEGVRTTLFERVE